MAAIRERIAVVLRKRTAELPIADTMSTMVVRTKFVDTMSVCIHEPQLIDSRRSDIAAIGAEAADVKRCMVRRARHRID